MRTNHRKPYLIALTLLASFLALTGSAFAQTADSYFQSAVAYFQQNKMPDCLASLKEAVKLDPNNWRAYQLMGNAYYKMNDARSALGAYDQSLKINSGNQALKDYAEKLRAALPPEVPVTAPSPMDTLLPGASSTPAVPKQKDSLYFFGGAGLPLSPTEFSNSRGLGYSGGFGYGVQVNPSFSLVFEAQESYFGMNSANFPGLILTGGEVSSALILVNGKIGFVPAGQFFTPYCLIGAGISFFTSNLLTAVNVAEQTEASTAAASETGLAYRLGLGFEIRVGDGAALFLDANGFGTSGTYSTIYGLVRSGVKMDL